MSVSLTTSVRWVSRGKAQTQPSKYTLDETELSRVAKLARVQLDEASLDLAAAQAAAETGDDEWEDTASEHSDDAAMDGVIEATARVKVDPDDLTAYNLDSYDEASRGAGTSRCSSQC